MSNVMVEGMVVKSNVNGLSSFSGNWFAILVYYLEVGDVGLGVVAGDTVFVKCTGDMIIAFL